MRLSEALYERKKLETRILRLMDYRRAIFKKELPIIKDEALTDRDKRNHSFLNLNKKEIDNINIEIDDLKAKFADLAHKITEKNSEISIDKKLMNMKFIRLELASLNKIREERYDGLDLDKLKETGIEKRLENIEEEKRKLDSQILHLNYTNEIML